MLSKNKYILVCLFLPIYCISCSKNYINNTEALAEAGKYGILILSDCSKWTPKAYAYFNYSLDLDSINNKSDMTNNIQDSDNDIDLIGCWNSVYLNCPNIN